MVRVRGAAATGVCLAVLSGCGSISADVQSAKTKAIASGLAGWSAQPTPPGKARRAAAVTHCKSQLRRLWRFERRHRTTLGAPPRLLKAAAVDTRGPYTLSLLIDGHRQATCFTGPRRAGHPFGAYGHEYIRMPRPAAGKISGFAGGITTAESGKNAYTYANGRTGAGVEGVKLLLADHRRIVTTTENGRYLVWWPGDQRVVSAEVKTATGTTTQSLHSPRTG
jgi:hypothetical protein